MDPHELFERMIEAWNGHDGDGFVATFAEDCEISSPVLTGKGHDVVRQFWELYDGAFPDYQVVPQRISSRAKRSSRSRRSKARTPGHCALRMAPRRSRRPGPGSSCRTWRSTRSATTGSPAPRCTGTRCRLWDNSGCCRSDRTRTLTFDACYRAPSSACRL